MNIAIDVDDCLSNTAEVDFETCWEYYKKLNKDTSKNFVNDYHNAPTIFGLTQEQGDTFYKEQRKLCIKDDLIKPKVFANKIIDKLITNGHNIIIISHRGDEFWGDAMKETKKWLTKYDIHYMKCITNCENKGLHCLQNHIDVLIDDNLKNIKQCNDLGVKTITFNNNYNEKYYPNELKNYKNNLNIYASCWTEVYEKIGEIIKEKEM